MKEKYALARWYAFKMCNDINPLDLVHDCYVSWYNKHEQDLFDLDQALIYTVLKQHYYSESRRYKRFKWRGETANRQFISLNEFGEDDNPVFELAGGPRADDLIISNELDYNIIKLLVCEDKEKSDLQLQIYELMKQNYKDKEIGEKVNRGRTAIHHYKTSVKRAVEAVLGYEG